MVLASLSALGDEDAPTRRAKPPRWTRDVLDAFFDDARKELVGERPAAASADDVEAAPVPTLGEAAGSPDQFKWSQLVDGETLATEVKRVTAALQQPLANPAKFKAGGYKQCRADFSLLAVLFNVIHQYDGEARWQRDAAALRDAVAHTATTCKSGADQTFNDAAERRTQLEDLIRGEPFSSDAPAELEKWSDLVERSPLMKRMELALQEKIGPQLANAKAFKKSIADVRHEAELLTVLANVIHREEYEYWDDEGFQQHARELQRAAKDLTRAAIEENYDAARQAAGRAGQACTLCHEGYRG